MTFQQNHHPAHPKNLQYQNYPFIFLQLPYLSLVYVLQPQQLELKRNKLLLMLTFLTFDTKRNILKTPEQAIKLFSLQNYDCRKADPGKHFKSCKSHYLTVTQNRTDSSFGFFLRSLFIPRFFKVSRRHAPRKTLNIILIYFHKPSP